ncbi:MAG: DNA polymerase Y family protein [Gammaproteobacteria bacterium]|nr:DNA polymerase Y family protein [Gammaproteobacteria bacterium]
MLWLCLHLPLLPLEVFVRGGQGRPAAVACKDRGRERVLVCNRAAETLGVSAGMRMSAAFALAPTLELHPRSDAKEARALNRLAAWSGQFSDFVSLRAPDAVLLEIRGSLRLFGGLDTLLRVVGQAADELGFKVNKGVAPTPLAACLLARTGGGVVVGEGWRRQLQKIPSAHLQQSQATLSALRDMGITTLAGCLRLPRSGLAKRFGPEFLCYLDRLLGKAAHPLARFEAPLRYAAHIALPAETVSLEALSFPLKRLLLELCGILAGRAAGVQELAVELRHSRVPGTSLAISLVAPNRDAEHLLMLVRERLDRVSLPAPVLEVGLRVDRFESLAATSGDLFGRNETAAGERFLDQLRSRLGAEAVDSVACYPEHRPERAWCTTEPGTEKTAVVMQHPVRPLWLLPRPQPLPTHRGEPCHEGALTLLEGPERIESGWWDGGDVTRDYFVACNTRGARYWVFQELRRREWFLHGIFA